MNETKTTVITARVDTRLLARAAAWLSQSSHPPRTRTEVLNLALALVSDQLQAEELSLEEYHSYLDLKFPVQSVRGGRRLSPKQRGLTLGNRPQPGETQLRAQYEQACALARDLGRAEPTFEEFQERMRAARAAHKGENGNVGI